MIGGPAGASNPDSDPFIREGFSPAFSNIVVGALKRGHNGRGYAIDVNLPEGHRIEIDAADRNVIADAVDHAGSAIDVAITIGKIIDRKEFK